jgi:hypothetical protein
MIKFFIIELHELMITTSEIFYEGSNIGNYTKDDQNQLSFDSFDDLELLAQPLGGGSNQRNLFDF